MCVSHCVQKDDAMNEEKYHKNSIDRFAVFFTLMPLDSPWMYINTQEYI